MFEPGKFSVGARLLNFGYKVGVWVQCCKVADACLFVEMRQCRANRGAPTYVLLMQTSSDI
jgi:hypothetical protein